MHPVHPAIARALADEQIRERLQWAAAESARREARSGRAAPRVEPFARRAAWMLRRLAVAAARAAPGPGWHEPTAAERCRGQHVA